MKTPDKITLERIKTAHPNIRTELEAQYIECNNLLPANCTLRFAFVYRSPQEQDELFNKRPKVTNAKGWQSIHNYPMHITLNHSRVLCHSYPFHWLL